MKSFDEEFTKAYLLRVGGIVIVVLLMMVVGLTVMYVKEVKKKSIIEPVFVAFDDVENRLVRIERGDLPIHKQALLRESILRQFVTDYFTVNHIDEGVRYARIRSRATDRVFDEFKAVFAKTKIDERGKEVLNEQSPLNDEDYLSEVEIVRVQQTTSNSVTVYFYQKPSVEGRKLPRTRWAALVSYDYRDVEFEKSDLFFNIDGITITRFLVQEDK